LEADFLVFVAFIFDFLDCSHVLMFLIHKLLSLMLYLLFLSLDNQTPLFKILVLHPHLRLEILLLRFTLPQNKDLLLQVQTFLLLLLQGISHLFVLTEFTSQLLVLSCSLLQYVPEALVLLS